MKKILIIISLIALVILVVACTQTAEPSAPESSKMPASGSEDVPETVVVEEPSTEETPTTETPPIPELPPVSWIKEFDIVAKQWEFVPNTITVNEGDLVKLTLTTADVTHGFTIPEYGINERIEPGQTVKIEFKADKKGTFEFFCSVPCGSGHSKMTGKLVVN